MKDRHDLPLGADFHARWRRTFERFALLHDDDAGIAGWTASGLEARLRAFRHAWSPPPPGQLWLDVGCGAGTYARMLDEAGLRVVGIDYSLRALEKARARSAHRIRWLVADVTRLPIAPATCDGALCFGVLQAIPESRPALEALAATLKPGGVLWIDALNAHSLASRVSVSRRRRANKPAHLRYETAPALVAALGQCGFDAITVRWEPILPGYARPLQRALESAPFQRVLRNWPAFARLISHSILIEATRVVPGR
jgi:SAM-dependent methyltransferase